MRHASAPERRIAFKVQDRAHMDEQLDYNVSLLLEHAMLHRRMGILVTRHSPCDFTVELHPAVPFGVTHERQDWQRTKL